MNNLLLALDTSSDEYQIVLGRDGAIIFDSAQDETSSVSRNISEVVSYGLGRIDAQAGEIQAIAVNIGPGSLSYVRSGVSFVNALAFSLGIPIYPFNYFEIVAHQAQKYAGLPVLCAVPAANNHVYLGLINGASVDVMRYGPIPAAVSGIVEGLSEVAVAGRNRHRISSLLNGIKFIDTGIEKPSAASLLELGYRASAQRRDPAGQVSPLNDQSEIFYEGLLR